VAFLNRSELINSRVTSVCPKVTRAIMLQAWVIAAASRGRDPPSKPSMWLITQSLFVKSRYQKKHSSIHSHEEEEK